MCLSSLKLPGLSSPLTEALCPSSHPTGNHGLILTHSLCLSPQVKILQILPLFPRLFPLLVSLPLSLWALPQAGPQSAGLYETMDLTMSLLVNNGSACTTLWFLALEVSPVCLGLTPTPSYPPKRENSPSPNKHSLFLTTLFKKIFVMKVFNYFQE